MRAERALVAFEKALKQKCGETHGLAFAVGMVSNWEHP